MSLPVLLPLTRDRILRDYLAAVLEGRSTVLPGNPGEGKLPPADLWLVDLDTVSPPPPPPGVRTVSVGFSGAPDLPRPFPEGELITRLFPVRETERLSLLPGTRSAFCRGVSVSLTGTEYRLLEALLSAGGEEVPKDCLTALLFGNGKPREDSLRVAVCNLRRKIEEPFGVRIRSRRGGGYTLRTE